MIPLRAYCAELNMQTCPTVGYPLWDLTSSGLTHSWGGPIKPYGIHVCTMGITRVGKFYPEKNWGEVEIGWVTTGDSASIVASDTASDKLDYEKTTVTMRIYGIDDQQVHIQNAVPLASLYRDPAGKRNGALDTAPPQGLREATLACAASNMSHSRQQVWSEPCAAFMNSCSPQIETRHNVWYFAGHTIVIGGLIAGTAGVMLSPLIAWFIGPYIPGGRSAAYAAVAIGLGIVWQFIQSMH